ncbi:MAG: transketolase [Anaerolineaceae bacterium]|nr:transketolase [Anaerolineaceae bacterium]
MSELENNAVNTLRFLAADAVQKANSGHPGFPMGAAAIAYTLFTRHLRNTSTHPEWVNRDRFILSGGHGSAMLYSLGYLLGFITLEDLQQFRQWGSITPGHPEFGLTPGVEATTGPLGQGFANGVGMAIAESHLAAEYNRPGYGIIDHYVYGIVTDGDLMEGVASEAASLAGHLKLGKLIYCYDDNHITIDGDTSLSFTEDSAARFTAYGWHVQKIEDGNNIEEIDRAITLAKGDPRPSLIICRTHIGFGSPNLQDTSAVHGSPLGENELALTKQYLNWPVEPPFYVPEDVREHFNAVVAKNARDEQAWNELWLRYWQAYPEEEQELSRRLAGDLPANWEELLSGTTWASGVSLATRKASGVALNALSKSLPELLGGSADLTSSNNAEITDAQNYSSDCPEGRNLHFGVREHAMGAIVNGLAYHGGILPFCATYLVFTDYLRPALRVAALSHLRTIYIMTHDSIFVGQDGPTHQPIEHLMALRLIPNVCVVRPADANETMEAWKAVIRHRENPSVFALARQDVPVIDRGKYASAEGVARGAYILADLGDGEPEMILMASGSEVQLIIEAGERLALEGFSVRLVSFPSWEFFQEQDLTYRQSVLPDHIVKRIAVEAGVTTGWERWTGFQGRIIGIDRFGASAPPEVLAQKFGFTTDNVLAVARDLLAA